MLTPCVCKQEQNLLSQQLLFALINTSLNLITTGDNIPIGTADLVKYPILPQVREHIANQRLDYKELIETPSIRERAKERITTSFDNSVEPPKKNKTPKEEVEIASFPLAILYVAVANDRKLTEHFALYEAQKMNVFLKQENREDVIFEVAKALKWKVNYRKNGEMSAPFYKYLESTTRGRLLHVTEWKLVNRALDKGQVLVTPNELARLLQEDVKYRIEELANRKMANLPEEIQKDVDEIKKDFIEKVPNVEYDNKIKAQESEYPPCITYLMKRASSGEHLSHTERFTLVTYLLHQGITVDSIVQLFSNVADFKISKTKYQVENLAGMTGGRTEPYTTYNCDTLKTHGVCKNPNPKICRTMRNPLTYHLRKQKIKSQENENEEK
jgi:DNA primase large subunit